VRRCIACRGMWCFGLLACCCKMGECFCAHFRKWRNHRVSDSSYSSNPRAPSSWDRFGSTHSTMSFRRASSDRSSAGKLSGVVRESLSRRGGLNIRFSETNSLRREEAMFGRGNLTGDKDDIAERKTGARYEILYVGALYLRILFSPS